MSRYHILKEKIAAGQKIYTPYVLLGYPSNEDSLQVAKTLIDHGVDALELGFPFRDPVADGPVIEQAANAALDAGFRVQHGFDLIAQIRKYAPDLPLTLMLYTNMVLARGVENFFGSCANAGLDAVLIPDLPPERADMVAEHARAHKIDLVFIVAPTSTPARLALIKPYAGGFIYVVTRMGITGSVEQYSDKIAQLFAMIKSHLDLPAIAGFGISTPDQAQKMLDAGADGVITGSRLIEIISHGNGKWPQDLVNHTESMVKCLKSYSYN